MSLEDDWFDPADAGAIVQKLAESKVEVPCNVWGLLKNMLVDMEVMSAEINSLKERVYTLEGLVK